MDLGTLPTLTSLENINIHGDNIRDLSSLSALTNLKSLDASYNHITDLSPLAGLTKLYYVDFRDNAISDVRPLAGLSGLTGVYLSNNRITDITPLASLGNFNEFYVDYNYLNINPGSPQKAVLDSFSRTSKNVQYSPQYTSIVSFTDANLKRGLIDAGMDTDKDGEISVDEMYYYDKPLDLSGRHIVNLTGMQYAYSLRSLNVSHNDLQDITDIIDIFGLTSLDISYNSRELDLSFLSHGINSYNQNLITLNLTHSHIKNIDAIPYYCYLENLDISANQIDDITPLAKNTHLKTLNMQYNYVNLSDSSQLDVLQTLLANGASLQYDLQYRHLTGVQLKTHNIQLYEGLNTTVELDFSPANAFINRNCIWQTNSANVDVDTSGNITAKYAGTAQVTVTTEDGGFKDTLSVKVLATTIGSPVYAIDRTNGLLTDISVGTTIAQFKQKLTNLVDDIKLYDQDDNIYNGNYVGTGMTVKLFVNGVERDKLKLAVFGDANGDGGIDINDILSLRAKIIGTYTMDNGQFFASDINKDGVIDINDILSMRAHIIGTYTISAK